MKTNDALDVIVGSSHQIVVQALLLDGDGVQLAQLPITGGQVTGTLFTDLDRWSAELELPLIDFIDKTGARVSTWPGNDPTHPLSGFSPHLVSIRAGAVVNTVPQVVEVARLAVMGCQRATTTSGTRITLRLAGLGTYIAAGMPRTYIPQIGETVQAFAVRILREAMPPWMRDITVIDTTTPEPMPQGYGQTDPLVVTQVLRDLAALADLVMFFDAYGRFVVKDPDDLTITPPAVRSFAVGVDVSELEAYTGRDNGFANRVQVDYSPFGIRRRVRATADWVYRANITWPNSGQIVDVPEAVPYLLRVSHFDDGGTKRVKFLDAIEVGDVLGLATATGGTALYQVLDVTVNNDQQCHELRVELLDTDGGGVSTNDVVELETYARASKTYVKTAEQVAGPLGTGTTGMVTYTDARSGAEAGKGQAYTDSLLANALLAWHVVGPLRVLPDPRIEPNDVVEVAWEDTTTRYWVTEVVIPLGSNQPMDLSLRTFEETMYA